MQTLPIEPPLARLEVPVTDAYQPAIGAGVTVGVLLEISVGVRVLVLLVG